MAWRSSCSRNRPVPILEGTDVLGHRAQACGEPALCWGLGTGFTRSSWRSRVVKKYVGWQLAGALAAALIRLVAGRLLRTHGGRR